VCYVLAYAWVAFAPLFYSCKLLTNYMNFILIINLKYVHF